jgi:hypothetical protein
MSLAAIPSSVILAGAPITPVILAMQSSQIENWSALGATVAAVLLVMWGRDKAWSLARRAASFIGAIFGGWSLPAVTFYNLPKNWLCYLPLDFPQTWAIAGSVSGIVAAQFFILLIWTSESASRRVRPRISKGLSLIGPDDKNPTDLGTEEQQLEESARFKAKLLKRLEKLQ